DFAPPPRTDFASPPRSLLLLPACSAAASSPSPELLPARTAAASSPEPLPTPTSSAAAAKSGFFPTVAARSDLSPIRRRRGRPLPSLPPEYIHVSLLAVVHRLRQCNDWPLPSLDHRLLDKKAEVPTDNYLNHKGISHQLTLSACFWYLSYPTCSPNIIFVPQLTY
ncbi:Os07g0196100, partial [Oryza sativa Japonica Group]